MGIWIDGGRAEASFAGPTEHGLIWFRLVWSGRKVVFDSCRKLGVVGEKIVVGRRRLGIWIDGGRVEASFAGPGQNIATVPAKNQNNRFLY